MRVESFDLFIKASVTEPTEFGKVVLFSTMDMKEKQNVQQEIGRIFNYCDDADDYINNHLLTNTPTLFWDRQSLLEKYGIADAHYTLKVGGAYNAPEGIIVSKLDTLKLLSKIAEFKWLPKTVYSREDAKKSLKFPIIAKASNTYQSRGVEKVSTKTALNKLTKGFDIFQEQINISEEYRVIFFRGHSKPIAMLAVYRRDPLNNKAKSLRVNEAGMTEDKLDDREKSNFSWTQVDPVTHSKLNVNECYQMAQVIFALNPTLNVTGMDIAVEKDGKHYFIETNSTPGLFSNMVPLLYRCIYEDHYGPMSEYAVKRLMELCAYFTYLTVLDEPSFRTETDACTNMFGYRYK